MEIITKIQEQCGLSCLSWHVLVNYELIIGLNWLDNTLELLLTLCAANEYYFRLINGLIGYFFKFMNPPFHTDSHPCIRRGGPVDCIGGPVDCIRRGGPNQKLLDGFSVFVFAFVV